MLIHFPVALWPAHLLLHAAASRLPAGAAPTAGFWLVAAGTALGWLAMLTGASDLLVLLRSRSSRINPALIHGTINAAVLLGFTVIALLEYPPYPEIHHGLGFLGLEAALIFMLFMGNYFGGEARGEPAEPPIATR